MGKLFKSLVAGVKSFKSPSKEKPAKDNSTSHPSKRNDRDHVRKRNKDKCMWGLGKSSSQSRDAVAAASSPDAIEIKCVQVDSEKLKDKLAVAESFTREPCGASKDPLKSQEAASIGNGGFEPSRTGPREHIIEVLDREEWAAAKIQAAFRCYLAQRAFRALRALVRLQALARGRLVRKQASTSLRCMQALIRFQALARGRRVRSSELGQLVQKHIQQTRQSRKKPVEGWINSMATAQQLHAKAQSKQEAVMKRQRALVYTFTEQLNKRVPKQIFSSEVDNQIDKSYWIWIWLERWMAVTTTGSSFTTGSEECSIAAKNIERMKTAIEANKHVEGRIANEVVNGMAAPLHASSSIEEQQKTSTMVAKRDDKVKILMQSEKLRVKKTNSIESNSATSVVGKPFKSFTPLPSPLVVTITEDGSPSHTALQSSSLACTTNNYDSLNALDTSSETVVTLSSASDSSLKLAASVSQLAVPTPSNMILSSSSKPATCAIQLVGATGPTIIATDSTVSVAGCQQVLFPSTSNGYSELVFSPQRTDIASDSPCMKSNSNCLSSLSCSPVELCSASESLSPRVVSRREQSPPPVCIPEHDQEDMPGSTSFTNGDAVWIEVAAGTIDEDTNLNRDETVEADTLSEAYGGCGASVVSVSAKSVEASNAAIPEQAECASPSIPSYMATTKSSKAKIRALTSPMQKSDLPKPKSDSPKPKTELLKLKVECTTPKPDSAMKRRHSLSAIEGKRSPGMQTQRTASHVRANSKGQLGLVEDTSTEDSPLSNGDLHRHVK